MSLICNKAFDSTVFFLVGQNASKYIKVTTFSHRFSKCEFCLFFPNITCVSSVHGVLRAHFRYVLNRSPNFKSNVLKAVIGVD